MRLTRYKELASAVPSLNTLLRNSGGNKRLQNFLYPFFALGRISAPEFGAQAFWRQRGGGTAQHVSDNANTAQFIFGPSRFAILWRRQYQFGFYLFPLSLL